MHSAKTLDTQQTIDGFLSIQVFDDKEPASIGHAPWDTREDFEYLAVLLALPLHPHSKTRLALIVRPDQELGRVLVLVPNIVKVRVCASPNAMPEGRLRALGKPHHCTVVHAQACSTAYWPGQPPRLGVSQGNPVDRYLWPVDLPDAPQLPPVACPALLLQDKIGFTGVSRGRNRFDPNCRAFRTEAPRRRQTGLPSLGAHRAWAPGKLAVRQDPHQEPPGTGDRDDEYSLHRPACPRLPANMSIQLCHALGKRKPSRLDVCRQLEAYAPQWRNEKL